LRLCAIQRRAFRAIVQREQQGAGCDELPFLHMYLGQQTADMGTDLNATQRYHGAIGAQLDRHIAPQCGRHAHRQHATARGRRGGVDSSRRLGRCGGLR
jgi:hypothetical protein